MGSGGRLVCVSHPGMPLVPQGAMKSAPMWKCPGRPVQPIPSASAMADRMRGEGNRGGQVYEPPTGG